MSDGYFLEKSRQGRLSAKRKRKAHGTSETFRTVPRLIVANGDREIHEALKKIASAKGIPLYVFLNIVLKRVVDENQDYLK